VAEDWRITITLDDDDHARRVVESLHELDAHDELRVELGGRVAVSRDGETVFLYADTRRAAEAAQRTLLEVVGQQGDTARPQLDRWHPIEERWEDASVPLPDTADEVRAERDRADEDDDAESLQTGIAQWEVRVEVASPEMATALAEDLELQGRSVVRRSTFLLVGANDRDDAEDLARELQRRGTVHVEPGAGVAWQLRPRNPFAVLGGLGN